jgi:hypothetical protein
MRELCQVANCGDGFVCGSASTFHTARDPFGQNSFVYISGHIPNNEFFD